MNAVDLIQRLHQHRSWVNGNLLSTASALTDSQLRRESQIGQDSIWKLIIHLYVTELVWLESLLGNYNSVVQGVNFIGRLPV